MLRWFAALLGFAGKSDMVLHIFTAIAAGAVLAFGVWPISNVALTIDALKNPYIAGIYATVLFFVGVGTIAWLPLRRPTACRRYWPMRRSNRPAFLSQSGIS